MAEPKTSAPRSGFDLTGVATVGAGGMLLANGAFYALARAYYNDRLATEFGAPPASMVTEAVTALWPSFAVFTLIFAVGLALAIERPRLVGHGFALIGAGILGAGAIAAWRADMNPVLLSTLIIAPVLIFGLAHFSWRFDRASWAFLAALTCIFALFTFFGAPKVRGMIDGANLWQAMIVPAVFVNATVGLLGCGRDARA